ncbi:MAG: hypothetical protein J6B09_08465 [Clostridia bacterium]|nr:hypothetical protein [Clostridia bacterium]
MKKILEDLWKSYQMENLLKNSTEGQEILQKLIMNEEILNEHLTDKQKEFFKAYDNCLSEISDICERMAFIKGIRFATQYLIEAIYGDT